MSIEITEVDSIIGRALIINHDVRLKGDNFTSLEITSRNENAVNHEILFAWWDYS